MARYTMSKYYPVNTINGLPDLDLLNNFFSLAFQIKRNFTVYTLKEQDLYRPDLLSFKIYGDPALWWILFKYNNIDDVWNDLSVGQVIYIPNVADIEDFIVACKNLK